MIDNGRGYPASQQLCVAPLTLAMVKPRHPAGLKVVFCLAVVFVATHVHGAPAAGPLRTAGRYIVNGAGERVRLQCASWSGAQEKWHVPSGLWAQPRGTIAAMAKAAGLNCIRLVWSVQGVLNSTAADVPGQALAANPDLRGKTPLAVMEAVVATLAQQGLMVILDNHSSDAMWCCNVDDGNGLWYTDRWTEQQWLQAWGLVAQRFAKQPAVVGMGLRNEPRPTTVGGEFLFPTWGSNDTATDLAMAYDKAATVILTARRTYLIIAQGNLAGRDLSQAGVRPVRLRLRDNTPVANQLVYESHDYPWHWLGWDFNNYTMFATSLDTAWGYLVRQNIAPVWLAEFGTTHDQAGITAPWWRFITRYIRELQLDWAYWPLDGQQGPSRTQGAVETYGLLNTTWNGFAYKPLIDQLALLGKPWPGASRAGSTSARGPAAKVSSSSSRAGSTPAGSPAAKVSSSSRAGSTPVRGPAAKASSGGSSNSSSRVRARSPSSG